jgi:hypothetical protein
VDSKWITTSKLDEVGISAFLKGKGDVSKRSSEHNWTALHCNFSQKKKKGMIVS